MGEGDRTSVVSARATTICIAEDRSSCEPALRILVASLSRHCPGLPILLFCPNATESFRGWIAAYPRCVLNPRPLNGVWTKYDIKPLALLAALDSGAEHVVWIDSDILVARDFRPWLAGLAPDAVVVTEEALGAVHRDPDGLRARLWGMPVGRALPWAANTGVIRVTSAHRGLLEAWRALLESEPYRAAQARPWNERGVHMLGDQEVLTALLASRSFADTPVLFLRRGRDIVQFFRSTGYTVRERLGTLRRGPPFFIHSQNARPWWPTAEPSPGLSARFTRLYDALSPYTTAARAYRRVLEDDRWLRPATTAAALLASRNPALAGLPLALAVDALRLGRAIARRRRRGVPGRSAGAFAIGSGVGA